MSEYLASVRRPSILLAVLLETEYLELVYSGESRVASYTLEEQQHTTAFWIVRV
jgi:hypothetical protein